HWLKISKRIEEGTFERDLWKLKHTGAQKRPEKLEKASSTSTPSKKDQQFQMLWEQLKKKAPTAQQIPDHNKPSEQVRRQVEEQRKRHPSRKLELKLERDAKGHVQVKLKAKQKPN